MAVIYWYVVIHIFYSASIIAWITIYGKIDCLFVAHDYFNLAQWKKDVREVGQDDMVNLDVDIS